MWWAADQQMQHVKDVLEAYWRQKNVKSLTNAFPATNAFSGVVIIFFFFFILILLWRCVSSSSSSSSIIFIIFTMVVVCKGLTTRSPSNHAPLLAGGLPSKLTRAFICLWGVWYNFASSRYLLTSTLEISRCNHLGFILKKNIWWQNHFEVGWFFPYDSPRAWATS